MLERAAGRRGGRRCSKTGVRGSQRRKRSGNVRSRRGSPAQIEEQPEKCAEGVEIMDGANNRCRRWRAKECVPGTNRSG